MQLEMLNAINHSPKYKILKKDVKIYNAEKHKLPCWECVVRPTCFDEKEATKGAKFLRYTVQFKKPCIEAILAMDLINMANSNLLISTLDEINKMSISDLFKVGFEQFLLVEAGFIDGQEYGPEAYALFISLSQRKSNKFADNFASAYHHLGRIFRDYFKERDHAISLYSKAIKFRPEIPEYYEERGGCYHMIGDFKNALNDYKNAVKINIEIGPYLEDAIEDCKMELVRS